MHIEPMKSPIITGSESPTWLSEGFTSPHCQEYLDFTVRHRDVITRFGRFPHRNKILGRESTPQELAFLAEPGSSF
jgi:uncharacterized protein (DUF924 family)